ncbi:MAG TPA: response regulator [Caldithrix abyssi]|uniref:Response regulator n=1 Tax=Caldithrix abyssi TaxID=187145 RepID=A0A7V5RP87_CALAY|nr:response regulator [Caldithrix abyssi]
MNRDKKTILYIDDDYQSGLLVKVFFEKEHFDVELVLNTEDARKVLREKHIDMVISDIGLPGENGIQFYEWLTQSEYRHIPIFLVSAHAMGFSHVLTEHRDIFFEKPLFFPSFIQAVKDKLNQAPADPT